MVNLLPAVLIGGPPHAGKSVLFYSLTRALRQRGIAHHAVRACPDGEGNWSQEIEQEEVRLLRLKGEWSDEFVERICRDLSRRLLPMLIDVGGRPQDRQIDILRHCTHVLLLLRQDEAASTTFWLDLVEKNGLLPLARISSSLTGVSEIRQGDAVIEGTLVRIERGMNIQGPLFELLVERLATLFSSYSLADLERSYLEQAPTELVLHLPQLLQILAPGAHEWSPQLLPDLLAYVPGDTPISVYGQGPHWLYSALIVHAGSQEFYQFDPRGPAGTAEAVWIAPPALQIGRANTHDVDIHSSDSPDFTKLSIAIKTKHLDYLQASEIAFPEIAPHKGLILDGSMPLWLMTALVRLYASRSQLWVACHQPRLKGAVVVATYREGYEVGTIIPL
ncbi:MAG TPA: CRISPR-associated protein Csx3 [Ktedonobacteraceae bacterium]|jgi:CRISPR-associated protein Csx3|nr:CRISPR-associated protein Csx3 [Ktedonobacteraceae bacterium]